MSVRIVGYVARSGSWPAGREQKGLGVYQGPSGLWDATRAGAKVFATAKEARNVDDGFLPCYSMVLRRTVKVPEGGPWIVRWRASAGDRLLGYYNTQGHYVYVRYGVKKWATWSEARAWCVERWGKKVDVYPRPAIVRAKKDPVAWVIRKRYVVQYPSSVAAQAAIDSWAEPWRWEVVRSDMGWETRGREPFRFSTWDAAWDRVLGMPGGPSQWKIVEAPRA